ncbi:sensor histidine kinase [Amaricoccus tamworthensis]|uniref:sensor histidine kinase n=1 Tax=Amaricoccus tamworthensis TaxID=57002 RepID=UPI003C7DCAAB
MNDQRVIDRIVGWFIPDDAVRGRTQREMARTFVFTHLFGPAIAQPMCLYLYYVSPEMNYPLVVMLLGVCSFWLLPFVLRWTSSIELAAFLSFQALAGTSLFGAFHYGGFSSPFLPWFVVSLLLGLFYLSKRSSAVLALFAFDIAVFLALILWKGLEHQIPIDDLQIIGWLSITSATVYMTWMALYYSRIIGLRSELEVESARQRATAVELEKARAIAEEIGRNRSQFFAKMSHELRTPLNAIIGYSDILLEDCEDSGPEMEQRSRDVNRINAAGRHLLSLVAEVLDANEIENDVMSVDIGQFTIGQLCDEVVATVAPMVEKNGNTFNFVCQNRDYVLNTDAKKLRQILLNLLSNAGKFTQSGTVRLELYVEFHTHDDHLCAVVSDTGIGISAEALPRLFKDYEQAEQSTFNRFGGTGIGLALSRRLAILLGGDISVTSRLGQGSRFALSVPAQIHEVSDDDEDDDPDGETAKNTGGMAA